MNGWLARHGRPLLRRLAAAEGGGFTVMQTVLSQMLVVVLNMATGITTARLLGPDGRGLYAAVTLWPQFLSGGFGLAGLSAAIVYHVRQSPAAAGTIFTASLILTSLLSVVSVAAGLVVVPLIMPGYSAGALWLVRLCVLATIAYAYIGLFKQFLISVGGITICNLAAVLMPLTYLVALMVCWAVTGITVISSVLVLLATSGAIMLWLGRRVLTLCRPTLRQLPQWLGKVGVYGLHSAPADMLIALSGHVDRLVLMSMVPVRDLGLYAVAFSLSRLMLILQTVVNLVLFPRMAGRLSEEMKTLHDHAFRFVSYASFGVVVLSFLLGGSLLRLMYGTSFADSGPVFDLLVIEAGLTCISQISAHLFNSMGLPGYPSIVQAVSFATAAIGLILVVPAHGILGAASVMAGAALVRLLLLLGGCHGRLALGVPRLYPRLTDLAYLRQQFRPERPAMPQ